MAYRGLGEPNIGDYIRTKNGYIGKVLEIKIDSENEKYYCCDVIMASCFIDDIKECSNKVIDLIEADDFVNDYIENGQCIKTILTHEQYKANCYKVV